MANKYFVLYETTTVKIRRVWLNLGNPFSPFLEIKSFISSNVCSENLLVHLYFPHVYLITPSHTPSPDTPFFKVGVSSWS